MTATVITRLAAAVVLSVAAPAAHAARCADRAVALSNFTTDSDGWSSNTPAEIVWSRTGGHKGGYLAFSDATSNSSYIDAPESFHGSYASLDSAGYIAFDHKVFAETGATSASPYEIRLSGPNGAAKFDGATPPLTPNGWITVVAPLSAGDWNVTSGTWAGLLGDVTDLQIDIELITNQTIPGDTDREGIDNVGLVQQPCGF